MKEKAFETLKELGFLPEESGNTGYRFCYEGVNYLCALNEDDEDYLSISVPAFFSSEEETNYSITVLPQKINSTLKYIKAFCMHGCLWLTYEYELQGNEDLKQLFSRMIIQLEGALIFSRRAIRKMNKGEVDVPEEETDVPENDTDESETNE